MICQHGFEEIQKHEPVVVLQCAHRLCSTCYSEYLRNTAHPACPYCRLAIVPSHVHTIRVNNTDPPAEPAPIQKAANMAAESDVISDTMDLSNFDILPEPRQNLIKEIEIQGQWGAKVSYRNHHA
jgi:DNA-directed RNA polymerase subunit RPC12/RpoP